MLNKAQGVPIEDFNEYLRLNPGSFSATPGQTSDDWYYTAVRDGIPARPAHVHDSTTYPSSITHDAWLAKLNNWRCSPARVAAGTAVISMGIVP